jgi:Flp pilus assembly protein TadG
MNGHNDPLLDGEKRRRRQRGASLAELAIVLPLLVLLTGSIVDLGWAFRTYQAVTNASREGARTGVRLPCYPANASQRAVLKTAIQNAVIAEAASSDVVITTAEITITPDPSTGCAAVGGELRVTVAHPHQTLIGQLIGGGSNLLSPLVPGGILTLRSSTAMAAWGTP